MMFIGMNAETGEPLGRPLTDAEIQAQAEWVEEQKEARARLYRAYHGTDFTKPDTPAEVRRFMQGYDTEKRCDKCFMLLSKSGACNC